MTKTAFAGFPAAGLQFLEALAQNNNKPWFEAHKAEYQAYLWESAVAFVAAMSARLPAVVPDIRVDMRTNGSGSLMRIYRDVRFSQDKRPYKTAVSGMFWQGAGKKTECPAFGFHLDAQGMDLMAGMFVFSKEQLRAYREAVVDEKLGPRLVTAVTAVTQAGTHDIAGKHYKQTPRGFDPDHNRAEWLLYNGLYTHPTAALSVADVTSPHLLDICLDHFQKMAPVQQWLVQALAST